MKKQNKRKGFALLEMLAVIGIIGALVAVIIPVVGGNTIRARAAANAANLRAIEAAVDMELLQNPENFEEFFETGDELNNASEGILGKIYDLIFGEGSAEESRAKYNSLADLGGYLEIPRSGKQITNVVKAKGMEAPDRSEKIVMNVPDKTSMRVYITAEGAVASYGDWTAEDFADVAEDGYYDGVVKGDGGSGEGGGIIGGIKDWLDEQTCRSNLVDGKHAPGEDCKCPYCGGVAHKDADKTTNLLGLVSYDSSKTKHGCSACGEKYLFNVDHKFSGSHDCVYTDCEYVSECKDLDPEDNGFIGIGGDTPDHKCYMCGGDNNHQWCTTDKEGGGSWLNPKPDHKCDTCGYTMDSCTYSPVENDATLHRCSKCEATATHSYVNGTCSGCGKTLPTCKWSTCTSTDVQSDGYCSSHQEKSCTAKVYVKYLGLQTCGSRLYGNGKYRDTTADCTNASNHHKCSYSEDGATYHTCDTCGDSQTHNYVDGKCTVCGRMSHIQGTDCVDTNPKDHKCDTGCGYTMGTHSTTDNLNNGTHGCSYCGAVSGNCSDGNKDHNCDTCGYSSMGGSCGAEYKYDSNKHYCKYCGADKGEHGNWKQGTDADPYHTCQTCGFRGECAGRRSCDVCGSTACITPDTLITLADGTQKRVDELTGNEMLLVWDHNTGKFAAAPVSYIIDHDKQVNEVEIMTLTFSDGNVLKIIGEHVFFDADEGKYVAITSENADSYIGHSFAAMSENSDSLHMAELLSVDRTVEETEVYEVVTHRTLTCFTNNVLSASAFIDGLLNIFEIDVETMAYDAEAKAADLEKYGTINYAFFAPFVSREIFDMYNGEYMSVAMGKDVLSLQDILDLIDLHYLYVND